MNNFPNLNCVQVTRSAEKVTNTGERREGEESLTITDIQRSVHSSEQFSPPPLFSISYFVDAELKGRSSGGSTPPGGAGGEGSGDGEKESKEGEVSLAAHCMSGLTHCFKVEQPSHSSVDSDGHQQQSELKRPTIFFCKQKIGLVFIIHQEMVWLYFFHIRAIFQRLNLSFSFDLLNALHLFQFYSHP